MYGIIQLRRRFPRLCSCHLHIPGNISDVDIAEPALYRKSQHNRLLLGPLLPGSLVLRISGLLIQSNNGVKESILSSLPGLTKVRRALKFLVTSKPIAFLLILAATCTMMACCFRKKGCIKARLSWKSKKRDSSPSVNWEPRDDDADEGPKIVFFGGSNYTFDLDDLLAASAEILGKGAFVTTYKVAVEDTETVVVKRMEEVVEGRRSEFEQQMEIVGRIRHENVGELKAYYYSKNDKLAVYSYYSQGNVFEMLHGNKGENRVPLDWDSRLRIIIGAARGLAIIHEAEDGKYVHGNIKSSNIFINAQGYGCICDLGLARIMMRSLPQRSSSGYQAPEITERRKCTQLGDVYSFGVVALELLTGKSPASQVSVEDEGKMDLASWTRSVVSKEWTGEVFDIELMREMGKEEEEEEEMVEMLQIGLACVDLKPQDRPRIAHVVKLIQDMKLRNTL